MLELPVLTNNDITILRFNDAYSCYLADIVLELPVLTNNDTTIEI